LAITYFTFSNNIDTLIPDVKIQKNPAQTKIQIKDDKPSSIFNDVSDDVNMHIQTNPNNSGKGKTHGKGKNSKFLFWIRQETDNSAA